MKANSFLIRERKVMNLEERTSGMELGGVEEGETIIRIYYLRKESIFNKGKKKHTHNIILKHHK